MRVKMICVQRTGVNMASQEDDNKLKTKSNVNKDQERNFINVYKQFEHILRNKFETFPKKIQSLIAIWKSLGQCIQQDCDVGYIIQIMDWAKLHTLNIVLTATWKKFKANYESKLLDEVERTQGELIKISDVFSKKFQKLADVIKNPWEDPILANLLHDNNAKIGPEEIEFFCVETAYLVSVRLKKLCESRCEDLALNLVTAFMRCYELSEKEKFSLNATKTHILFCFDVHIALLYRYKRNSEIVEMFKKLSLDAGLQLIRRFTKKRVKISKVWRHYPEITFLASQVFVTATVTKPFSESGIILRDLLDTWIVFSEEHNLLEKLETSIRKIIQAATDSEHIYVCCDIIHDKLGTKLKTFTVELYIRALTTDMNNLESQRSEGGEKDKLEQTTKRLANGFQNLADILKDNIQVSRECALTAFSLDPTLERLRTIEEFARLSGIDVLDTGQIWECKLHPPVTSTDEICWICNACGKWMCKPNLDLHLSTNFALNEALNFETLGISSQLCDDLAVVLNGPRYQLLCWLLRWKDLHSLCEMYLNDMERTKNLVTELKFVEIDYSMFVSVKREPVDEHSGIEKGYEHFLYSDEKTSEAVEMIPEPEAPQTQTKSDPNTLKTLRMFRHNVKRNRPQYLQSLTESNNSNSSNSSFESYKTYPDSLNFQFQLNKFQNHPFTQAVFGHNSSRSPGGNSLNRVNNSPLTRAQEEPVDFSSSSNRLSDISKPNSPSSSIRDFRMDFQKRKTAENSQKNNINIAQSFSNFMKSGDNFLHNMITYEFAKANADSKTNRHSNNSSQLQHLLENNKESEQRLGRLNDHKRLQNTDNLQQNVVRASQYINPIEKLQLNTSNASNMKKWGFDTPGNTLTELAKVASLKRSEQLQLESLLSATMARLDQKEVIMKANASSRHMNIDNRITYPAKQSMQAITSTQTSKDSQSILQEHTKPVSNYFEPKARRRSRPIILNKHFSVNRQSMQFPANSEMSTSCSNVDDTSQKHSTDQNYTSEMDTSELLKIASNDRVISQQETDKRIQNHKSILRERLDETLQKSFNSKRDLLRPTTDIRTHNVINTPNLPPQSESLRKPEVNISFIKDFKHKEYETLAPSKGFPSFDKIPPPPHLTMSPKQELLTQNEEDIESEHLKEMNSSEMFGSNINKLFPNGLGRTYGNKINKLVDEKLKFTSKNPNTESDILDNTMDKNSLPKISIPSKNEITLNEKVKRSRNDDNVSQDLITKRKKLEENLEEKAPSLNSRLSPELQHELSQNKIIKTLLEQNCDLNQQETPVTSVQKENSSKNANCCLPVHNNDSMKKNDEKVVIKTPVISKVNNNNSKTQNNVVSAEPPCCKTSEIVGKADKNIDKVDLLSRKNYSKDNKDKCLLLKTLSEQHIPLIVENEAHETKSSKSNSCGATLKNNAKHKMYQNIEENSKKRKKRSGDTMVKIPKNKLKLDKGENGDKQPKQIKVVLQRLSNDVVNNHIPPDSDRKNKSQSSSLSEMPRKKLGRPRKHPIVNNSQGALNNLSRRQIPNELNLEKDVRILRRHRSDTHNELSSGTAQNSSDIVDKKTGLNKSFKNISSKKNIDLDNQKRADSDISKKPKKDCSDKNKKNDDKLNSNMNPRVILERLPLNSNYIRSVLSNVPGLNDYEMIRPSNVNHIVNVVQISGGRSTTTVPVQNTQTSTQITPHIQRIGQPRSDKPEHNTNSEVTATTTSTLTTIKPSTSQPSTLINILSQQMIRPGQSNCVRNRSSPLINILSQQIVRPATSQINKVVTNSIVSSELPPNNSPKNTSTIDSINQNDTKPATTTAKTVTTTPVSGQSTILQFICKSSLPKFQQAFGKSVYQNSTETTDATSTSTETTSDVNKKTLTKNSSVNIQPIQGGVIYTRQMPVGQTINLIPPGRGQVFRIAASNSDQISLVKDSVIHSKMSALLAAALQGKQKSSESQSDGEATLEETSSNRITVARPTLVQNARIVKPVLQIPSNVIRTSPQSNLSSTTLEQLREFDMVYKQIKERSSTGTPSESNTSESNEASPRISVAYVNQSGQKYTQLSPVVVVSSSYCNLQPAASPALSVTSQGSSSPCVTPAPTPATPKVSSKSSKGKTVKNNTTTQASKSSPIPKPQQKPQEDEHTTQRIFDILAEYAEQLRNSPDLNNKPAPRRRSNPPTNPSQNSKRKKSSGSKKSGLTPVDIEIEDHRTVGSEDSSCGVVQISVQDEEQPTHVPTVVAEANDNAAGTRQQLILTDPGNNQTRNLIITDSSVGEALKMSNAAVLVPGNYIMPVSMVKGGQQIAVVSGGSKILATVPARSGPNMLLFQSFLNQNRTKSGVPTVKYSTIQPISGISSQNIAGVSGQPPVILPPNSHNLTAVALGQSLTLKKIDEGDRVNTELLLTISQPRDNANSSSESSTHTECINRTSNNLATIDLEDPIMHSDNSSEKVFHSYQKSVDTTPIATPVIASCVKEEPTDDQNTHTNSMTLDIATANKSESTKTLERVQSVLVTACTSNGPMLSHTPPRYRKASESTGTNIEHSSKEEFLHNGEKQNNNEQKQFQGNATYFQAKNKKTNNPQRLDKELQQLCLQRKQAAFERELRLQKSLSEECEDLGVDEPSTSDLFPEADILFDSNQSPSFDQSSQDLVKRSLPLDIKEDNKSSMTLFSDDDNSGSLRTDFLFEPVEYQTTGAVLEYDQNQQLTNGQSSASNESGSSCEDNTLLQNCASMSDVTLNSPVSPDPYHETTPPSLNKYKFKYSNRRKGERHKQTSETWTAEVSSSEDTTGSTELGKSSSHSPESCINKGSHSVSCDDELSDGSYKIVRVAISKSDLLKDDESCEELHCDDDLDCSPSGRGARRSVKKLCCCCNGSQEGGGGGGASRKRPSSRPHTPAPHKKAFLNKKR